MIKDRDLGFKKIMQEVKKLEQNPSAKIGIQGKDASEIKDTGDESASLLTVVEVGNFHEFGLGNNPERSFLRATIDENRAKYLRIVELFRGEIFKGKMTVDKSLGLLGEKIKSDIQKRITDGIDPPLSPETIARKGSDVPLIDTGQLRQSITWTIERKGK